MTHFDTAQYETLSKIDWSDKVLSASNDETQIIRWIMKLHNNGQAFDVDPTYSTGRFWEGLPKPKHRFDVRPQTEGVVQADARRLPLASESVNSIMFDPPFVIRDMEKKTAGKIANRFFAYKTHRDLWRFYQSAIAEFWRVLRAGGILVFKCQDTISGGKQYMSHYEVMKQAEEIGYYCKDLFILLNSNVLWSPNMENQQHARKAHSYFIVFRKPR